MRESVGEQTVESGDIKWAMKRWYEEGIHRGRAAGTGDDWGGSREKQLSKNAGKRTVKMWNRQ